MDYNIRNGRTYMYFKGEPLYPFGYGLSYTTFDYSNLKTSSSKLRGAGEVAISVDVRNSGSMAGDEVVQMYLKHIGSKVDRPLEELKGFERITLLPKEAKTVRFTLKSSDIAYWDADQGSFVTEPDHLEIRVGGSSADIRLKTQLEVTP